MPAKIHSPRTYPSGTTRRLLETDALTLATRQALSARLAVNNATATPRFFDEADFATLQAACSRLIPQTNRAQQINIASDIDKRLAEGTTNGWRYNVMPPDGDAYRLGLRGLDETAQAKFNRTFDQLDALRQDEVLRQVQQGTPEGPTWAMLSAARFFEELLAEAVETYYSHPLAQDEIGYVGYADALGWTRIGLNQLEPPEPQASNAARASDDARAREDAHD